MGFRTGAMKSFPTPGDAHPAVDGANTTWGSGRPPPRDSTSHPSHHALWSGAGTNTHNPSFSRYPYSGNSGSSEVAAWKCPSVRGPSATSPRSVVRSATRQYGSLPNPSLKLHGPSWSDISQRACLAQCHYIKPEGGYSRMACVSPSRGGSGAARPGHFHTDVAGQIQRPHSN